jgi:hypothetical protein
MNVSYPVVFLEYASCIRLEYHKVHKPFSISMNLLIYLCHKVLLSQRGYVRFEVLTALYFVACRPVAR